MNDIDRLINDLVIANRILANEGVVDAYGHISVRHPTDPGRYFLSRSRSPALVEASDILEFTLDGTCVSHKDAKPYLERFIHGAVYEARPEVHSIVHSHAYEVLPFTVSSVPLRPVFHTASQMGTHVPVWDIEDKFGDTNLLVVNMEQGRDLARCLAGDRVVLMRGHGFATGGNSIADVVKTSVYLPRNAQVMMDAVRLGGTVKYLSEGEVAARAKGWNVELARGWDYWAMRAGCGELLRKYS
jgi:ribulose-5-phosphate 4-epimerase/fuculose-1-phosphate aldolase